MSKTQELTTQAFLGLVNSRKQTIKNLVPEHVNPERMLRLTVTAFQQTPKLAACVPITILNSIIHAAQLGLEFNTPMGHAYLVPFYNRRAKCMQCQLIIGYKGLLDLAYRSGQIDACKANLVYDHDTFDLDYGREPFMSHKPILKGERGDWYAGYCMIRHSNGMWVPPLVMRRDEIDKVKQMSSSRDKDGNIVGPWRDHEEAMALKTVVKRALKVEHLSVEYQRASGLDDQADTHAGQEQLVEPDAFDGFDPADLMDGSDLQLEEGSAEKLEEVKQRRLIEAGAVTDKNKPTTGKFAWLWAFQELKKEVGQERYATELGAMGYEHSNEIPADQREGILKLMRETLRPMEEKP